MDSLNKKRFVPHLLMVLVIFIWGFDYVPVKMTTAIMPPITLLVIKNTIGLAFMLSVKLISRNFAMVKRKDLLKFALCALFGDTLYFYCEYKALDYLPVAMVTIILAFVPVASIIIERIFKGRKASKPIICGIIICILGVALVAAPEFRDLFSGSAFGYVLCFGAVIFWNMYNFFTIELAEYDTVTLTAMQMFCSIIIAAPVALYHFPPLSAFTPGVLASLAYLGVVDTGIAFLLQVYSLKIIGPTPLAVYSNLLPITSTAFSILFLGETVTWLQVLGGILVIGSGIYVVRTRGKEDAERLGDI